MQGFAEATRGSSWLLQASDSLQPSAMLPQRFDSLQPSVMLPQRLSVSMPKYLYALSCLAYGRLTHSGRVSRGWLWQHRARMTRLEGAVSKDTPEAGGENVCTV